MNSETYPLVSFPHVTREIVHGDIFATVRAVGFLAQVDALHVVVEQLLGLELLFTVGTLVVPDLLVEILDVVVKILVLLVADVTGGGFGEMNLLDVVLQGVLRHKLLFTEGAFSHLGRKSLLKELRCFNKFIFTLL